MDIGLTLAVRGALALSALVAGGCNGSGFVDPGPGAGRTVLTAMTVGEWHSCAILGEGSGAGPELLVPAGPAVCWGRNDAGQLGVAEPADPAYTLPTAVSGGLQFRRLAAGRRHTCGLGEDGTVYCWGGDVVSFGPVPVPVLTPDAPAVWIAAGDDHACAVDGDGALWCWGANDHGQLGDGTTLARREPVRVSGEIFVRVTAGGRHTCALTASERTWCWGDNTAGQLGVGRVGEAELLPLQVMTDRRFSVLTAGAEHTCAMTSEVRDGGKPAYCWGSNAAGQLGQHLVGVANPTPAPVDGEHSYRALDAGRTHTCGVVHNVVFTQQQAPNNIGYCWGSNQAGQIGNASALPEFAQPDSVRINRELQGVSAGGQHTCAVSGDAGFCWGSNVFGQLGNGTFESSRTPRVVVVPDR